MRLGALGILVALACSAFGQAGQRAVPAAAAAAAPGWDEAFADRSGERPLHFVATYLDGDGRAHRLEEWRVGLLHVRRRTDDRIDLHADALAAPLPGRAVDYVWQVLDLQRKIDHRMSSGAMLRAGHAVPVLCDGACLEPACGAVRGAPHGGDAAGGLGPGTVCLV